uniref:CUB domain-containing protein n=1 Tax=Panagrolaimus sp. JU765 TaxID=591449 RepID=A0AC34R8W5_9BILA
MKGQPGEKTTGCDTDLCGFNIHTHSDDIRVESGLNFVPISTSCLEVSIRPGQMDFPGFSKMCTWNPDENDKLSVKLELPDEYTLELINATIWKEVKSADSTGLPDWALAIIIIGVCVIVIIMAAIAIYWYIKQRGKEEAPLELRIVPSKTKKKDDDDKSKKNQPKQKSSRESASSAQSSRSSTKSGKTRRSMKLQKTMVSFFFLLLLFVGAFAEKLENGGDIVLRVKSEGFQLKVCQLKANGPKFFFCMKGQPEEKSEDCSTDFCGFRVLTVDGKLRAESGLGFVPILTFCLEVSVKAGHMYFPGFSKACTWKPDENEKLPVKLELPNEYSLEVIDATTWKDVKSADSAGLPTWGLALIIIGIVVIVVFVAASGICCYIKKCKKEGAPSELRIVPSKTRKNDDESKGNNQRKRKTSHESVSSASNGEMMKDKPFNIGKSAIVGEKLPKGSVDGKPKENEVKNRDAELEVDKTQIESPSLCKTQEDSVAKTKA